MTTTSRTDISRALATRMYEAAARGDLDDLLGCLSDDLVVNEPPFLPYGGVYRGLEEFKTLVSRVGELLDISKVTVNRMVAEDDRVIGIIEMPDLKTGRNILLAEEALVRGGKFVEIYVYFHETRSMLETDWYVGADAK